MPQDKQTQEEAQEKQLRSQMREGRKPLIEACHTAYQKYLIGPQGMGTPERRVARAGGITEQRVQR